jgi:outer membrane receptor protein involved in Fe transport
MPSSFRRALALLASVALFASSIVLAQAQVTTHFDLPAQPLADSLRYVGSQTHLNVLFDPLLVAGRRAPALKGELTLDEVLTTLLADTGIKYEFLDETTLIISAVAEAGDGSRVEATRPSAPKENPESLERIGNLTPLPASVENREPMGDRALPQQQLDIPEILVFGKTLNFDIRRSRDDALPYVVFDREKIERSGVSNLEGFLKGHLPQNTVAFTGNMDTGQVQGNTSQVNLRGLGTNQTLILIDGRRAPTYYSPVASTLQPDINGIPLSAVERIEVLPATASGIYGGSAVGGVVNIVLRHDYSGLETKLTYGNTLDQVSGNRRIEVAGGFTVEGGKTMVLLSGSYDDRDALVQGDRGFAQRYYQRSVANVGSADAFGGSTPYGSTTNITSADGSDLVLKSGTVPLGSPATFVPHGYAGPLSDGGRALVANAGRYNLDLAPGAQDFIGFAGWPLSNATRVKSAAATVRRQFGTRLQAFADFNISSNLSRVPTNSATRTRDFLIPEDSAANPFQQDISVTFAVPDVFEQQLEARSDRLATGAILQLAHGWTAEADFLLGHSRSRFEGAPIDPLSSLPGLRAAVADGAVAVLRDTTVHPFDAYAFDPGVRDFLPGTRSTPQLSMTDASARLAGPLPGLPAGPITLTSLIERRQERLSAAQFSLTSLRTFYFPQQQQTIWSAYLESRVPLLESLELQLAARHDRYVTEGSSSTVDPTVTPGRGRNTLRSTDPTIALKYTPWRGLLVRASYGTGFLPPATNQIVTAPPRLMSSFEPDPRRGNTRLSSTQPTLFIRGGNPNLDPEQSQTWSAGIVLTPAIPHGLRVSLDYVRIRKTDAIFVPGVRDILANESLFPDRVTRGPKLATDPPDWAGPVVSIDQTLLNIARTQVGAYDLQLDYDTSLGRYGELQLFAVATRQTHFRTQTVPQSPLVDLLGHTVFNPLNLKGNLGLTWSRGGWSAGWMAQYFHSYLVYGQFDGQLDEAAITAQGGRSVPHQTYHDAFVAYRTSRNGEALLARALDRTEISLTATNVFNKTPPFDALAQFYSLLGDPHLSTYSVSLKKTF